MDTTIESRPQTDEILHARQLIVRFADHTDELDLLTSLRAKMAESTLHDVYPPFPPLEDLSDLTRPSIEEVRQALTDAARSSGSVEIASVIARAAAELNGDGML